MEIDPEEAINFFYPNPSLNLVYLEAVVNALDAMANKIEIDISMSSFVGPKSLSIKIRDNGHGFNDDNFERFRKLLKKKGKNHKGCGRLVYLTYFDRVHVQSSWEGGRSRDFYYSKVWDALAPAFTSQSAPGTVLDFEGFLGEKVKSYEYVVPDRIKGMLLDHLLPMLFLRNQQAQDFHIKISLSVEEENRSYGFYSNTVALTPSDVPELKNRSISTLGGDLFADAKVMYLVEKTPALEGVIKTSLCIDSRAVPIELLPNQAMPIGFRLVAIFDVHGSMARVNPSRQNLEVIDGPSERLLRGHLRRELGEIIKEEIPQVVECNDNTRTRLVGRFPHLVGLFPSEVSGLLNEKEAIQTAQDEFSRLQLEVLGSTEVDQETTDKALNLSARALMEYVLYREKIILNLKALSEREAEKAYHNIIAPMRCRFEAGNLEEDMYNNNIWLLDDKFMSYSVVLSDKEIKDLLLAMGYPAGTAEGRPDVAIVFSGDPSAGKGVSTVIVELKKKNIEIEREEEIILQIKQRARCLLRHFTKGLDRVWFFGITEISPQFRTTLKEDFQELYSVGQVFYKRQPIEWDENQPHFNIDLVIMNYDALIADAEVRNKVFTDILRRRLSMFVADSVQARAIVMGGGGVS